MLRPESDFRRRLVWCERHIAMCRHRLARLPFPPSMKLPDRWLLGKLTHLHKFLLWALGEAKGDYDPANIMVRTKARDAKVRTAGEPTHRICKLCSRKRPITMFERTGARSTYRRHACVECYYQRRYERERRRP